MIISHPDQRRARWQASPALIWLGLFFLLPLVLILLYSFQSRANDGTVNWTWTLDNYAKLLRDGSFWRTLWLSTWMALVVTFITLIVSYPLAYWMATRPKRWRNLLLLAVMYLRWNVTLRFLAAVFGTEGWIEVPPRFHHPDRVLVHRTGGGRSVESTEEVLAPATGTGYAHELDEVHRCLAAGATESDVMPLADTLAVMSVLEQALHAMGVHHDEDPAAL